MVTTHITYLNSLENLFIYLFNKLSLSYNVKLNTTFPSTGCGGLRLYLLLICTYFIQILNILCLLNISLDKKGKIVFTFKKIHSLKDSLV